MRLSDLPDIDFVSASADEIETALLKKYTEITGRSLAQGDPIRLFILFLTEVLVRLRNDINYTAKMNLLKYAEGDFLDNLGALLRVERLPAAAATVTLNITLSAARAVATVIPQGTRVASGDNIYFALDKDVIIAAGDIDALASATCVDVGTVGNGYLAGEIKTIVDPVPYVASMVSFTKSEGGTDIEGDDAFKERIFEAPEKFSCAGSEGAYIYWAKTASSAIADVSVYSPESCVVNVYPLLTGGEVPGTELLNTVYETLNDATIRPLTDKVNVLTPEVVEYDIDLKYYIFDDANATAVGQKVADVVDEYVLWQKSKLGRDIVPDKLIEKIRSISGIKRVSVYLPEFTEIDFYQVAWAKDINAALGGAEYE